MKVSDFYNNDYVDYASYSTLRMLGSAIDGQKNVHRKILYTIIEKNIRNDIKVSQLNSKMAEFSEYLHGDASRSISGMAQEFAGTNNIPLLVREGNFGTRFNNEPSAPRYIFTHGSDDLWKLINLDDSAILDVQYFEGDKIEPKFYLPTLPLILVNGSEGLATGFAQKILSRNPKKIKKYITDYLKENLRPNKSNSLEPYFEGFAGTIEQGESNKQWLIKGVIQRNTSTKVTITEIPVGIELKQYLKTLDRLEDTGVIRSYKDLSNKTFKFEVNFIRGVLDKLDDDKLLEKLKNYTAIDEHLKVKTFESAKEIIDYYIDVKKRYLQKRKDYLINKVSREIRVDVSRYMFIQMIVTDELIINKRKKANIETDLEGIGKIIKQDDSYNYLLNMPVVSLTEERMNKLLESIKNKKEELDLIKNQTLNKMWLKDLT